MTARSDPHTMVLSLSVSPVNPAIMDGGGVARKHRLITRESFMLLTTRVVPIDDDRPFLFLDCLNVSGLRTRKLDEPSTDHSVLGCFDVPTDTLVVQVGRFGQDIGLTAMAMATAGF